MNENGGIDVVKAIELINSRIDDPTINKVYFFWSPPYITLNFDIDDVRMPIDYITMSDWCDMCDEDRYDYVMDIARKADRQFMYVVNL